MIFPLKKKLIHWVIFIIENNSGSGRTILKPYPSLNAHFRIRCTKEEISDTMAPAWLVVSSIARMLAKAENDFLLRLASAPFITMIYSKKVKNGEDVFFSNTCHDQI